MIFHEVRAEIGFVLITDRFSFDMMIMMVVTMMN